MSSTTPLRDFADLGVPLDLVEVLTRQGITTPFPIQAATLPDSLAGRDLLGRGVTGSGKTLAFALPIVARLAASARKRRAGRPRALVLVPTRELAAQVAEVLQPLARALGLTVTTIYGGVGQRPQVTALRGGVDVVIACPGRLEDLLAQGHLTLGAVEVSVLDEADHMADLGFLPAVRRILDLTPAGGQRLLFSATLDNGVDVLVRRYLSNPKHHAVEPVANRAAAMTHHVFTVEGTQKAAVVRELASGAGRSLLFTRTKHGAKKLAAQLTASGIPAADLHGNLAQSARERNLAAFADGSVRVLVATDIAARGIHVDGIELVVHVDPPAEHKAYTHRSGRTARAGAEGVVVTISTPDQATAVRTLTRQAGITPRTAVVAPGAAAIVALTGPPAAYVTPAARPVTPPAPPRGRRRPAGAGTGAQSGRPARAARPRTEGAPQHSAASVSASSRSTSSRGRRGGQRRPVA